MPKEGAMDPALFTRAHNGWAEGMHIYDRFMKNTYEVLSPLYELTADVTMDKYQTLPYDYAAWQENARRSITSVEVAVKASGSEYKYSMSPGKEVVAQPDKLFASLHDITSNLETEKFQVLGADSKVKRSVFGTGRDAVEVIVNEGEAKFSWHSKIGGDVLLPPYGFLIEAPSFAAFCALNWNGVNYGSPVMFTLRSTDGKSLGEKGGNCRVYHAFGDSRIKVGDQAYDIKRESVVPR
jgi:hypothetical protein